LRLNEELEVEIPEGFYQMSEAELDKLSTNGDKPNWCIKDPDRHIIFAVSWKKSAFSALLLKSEEVAQKMESRLRKPMEQFGYHLQGFISKDAGGKTADGFRYDYTSQGVGMTAESFSIKNGKVFYYINIYMRTELLSESEPVVHSLMDSFRWS